jgi:hypothetical protein
VVKKKKYLPKLLLLNCKELKEKPKNDFEKELSMSLVRTDRTIELEDYFFTCINNLIIKPKTSEDYDCLDNMKQLFGKEIIEVKIKRDYD